MSVKTSRRQIYLDVLRVLASFLICYNHAFGYHLFLEQEADGSLISWLNVFNSAMTSVNIPLFLMLSGALLLGRTESYRVVFRKRICRFLVLILAVSLAVYLLVPQQSFSFSDFFYRTMYGNVAISHWYLFAYLGFLLLLPMVRNVAQHMTHTDFWMLVLLRTLLKPCLMIANFWLDHFGLQTIVLSYQLQIPLSTTDAFFYPLIGYYLANKLPMERLGKKQMGLCAGIFLGSCLLATLMAYAEGLFTGFSQTYVRMFDYSSAMSLFVLVRWAMERITLPKKMEKILIGISGVTIGIYLLEPIVIHYLYDLFFRGVPWENGIIMVYSLLWSVTCMAVGGSITWLLRKIPGVSKFL